MSVCLLLQEGKTGWEKLRTYCQEWEQNIGANEVDNVGLDEYGPHTVSPSTPVCACGKVVLALKNTILIQGFLLIPAARLCWSF